MNEEGASIRDWMQRVQAADFLRRLGDEPGFLDLRDSDDDGLAPLHHAAAEGRCDLIRIIVERQVSADLPSGTVDDSDEAEGSSTQWTPGLTPLMCAARRGQVAAARLLLDAGADPQKPDYSGFTALHSAAVSGSVAVANVLLSAGSDPEAYSHYRAMSEALGFYWVGSPLHVAACNNHEAIAKTLIGHGANVDSLTSDDRRPLHYASAEGAARVLEVLLRAGADPNRPEKFHRQAPIHYAAREGHVENLELLLRHGADPSSREDAGFTPLQLARSYHLAERAKAMCRLLRRRI